MKIDERENNLKDFLLDDKIFTKKDSVFRFKVPLILSIAILNGILYGLSIPLSGGESLKAFLGFQEYWASYLVYGLCAGAGVCYTMFYFKTLEAIDFKFTTRNQVLFALLAPFSACGYLTGGVEGSQLYMPFFFPAIVGVILYSFRILSCVDASYKFPKRFAEMKGSWNKAIQKKDKKEIIRLFVTGFSSLGYALASTDSICFAIRLISRWLQIPSSVAEPLSYGFCIFGAIGIFPLTLYWTHRGLKQLTGGGEVNPDTGENPDPTDKYTYYGFLFVLPNILGVLGAATSEKNYVFGRLGIFSEAIRIFSSLIYAGTSGTPGMSTLFRTMANKPSICSNNFGMPGRANFFKTVVKKESNELILSPGDTTRLIIDGDDQNQIETQRNGLIKN